MSEAVLFSVVESSAHPNFSALYRRLGIAEVKPGSMRKAIALLKKQPPDFVVADFFYGYGNNYAGVNVSNLDVFLASLQKYSPGAKVIILVDKSELTYVEKLKALFDVHAVFTYPVAETRMQAFLESGND